MAARDRGHSLFARRALSCLAGPPLSQRHLAWFCVTCGKLPLFGSPRLLALGISGLFSVLTLGTDWIATTPEGDERVMQEIIAVRQFTHGQFFRSFQNDSDRCDSRD